MLIFNSPFSENKTYIVNWCLQTNNAKETLGFQFCFPNSAENCTKMFILHIKINFWAILIKICVVILALRSNNVETNLQFYIHNSFIIALQCVSRFKNVYKRHIKHDKRCFLWNVLLVDNCCNMYNLITRKVPYEGSEFQVNIAKLRWICTSVLKTKYSCAN